MDSAISASERRQVSELSTPLVLLDKTDRHIRHITEGESNEQV